MYFYDRCERRVDEKYVEGTSVRFHDSLFTVSDARAPATRKNILLSAASIRRDGHHGRHKAPQAMVSSSAATNCSPMFVDQVPKISEIRRAIFYPVAADASHPHALRDRSDSTLKLILFYFATPSSLPFPSIIEKFPNLRRHEKTASWILLSDGNFAFFFSSRHLFSILSLFANIRLSILSCLLPTLYLCSTKYKNNDRIDGI